MGANPNTNLFAVSADLAAPTVTNISPTSGPAAGATTVTITGTNFTGATAVNFGNTAAASFTINSATSITATSPTGSGTVDITVTTPSGTSATSAADQFTFQAPQALVPPPFVDVAFTLSGQQVTEVVSSSGVLTEFNPNGHFQLATGVRSASVAFGTQGEIMVVVFQTGQLVQFDPSGSHVLDNNDPLSAGVGIYQGQEVLEVVSANGTLTQFDTSGAHQLASGVQTANVAFGSVGEVLDVVFASGQLFQYDATGTHQLALNTSLGAVESAGVGLVPSMSEVLSPNSPSMEVLDAFFANSSLWQFDATGGHQLLAASV